MPHPRTDTDIAPAWAVTTATPDDPEVQLLMSELSQVLLAITGDSGTRSFAIEDLRHPRARLLVARDAKGVACACGALRPLDDLCGEIKRMYARTGSAGAGSVVLKALERDAAAWGYAELKLSTRRVNARAVAFYRRHGYAECAPFGRYVGRDSSICMGKSLVGLL